MATMPVTVRNGGWPGPGFPTSDFSGTRSTSVCGDRQADHSITGNWARLVPAGLGQRPRRWGRQSICRASSRANAVPVSGQRFLDEGHSHHKFGTTSPPPRICLLTLGRVRLIHLPDGQRLRGWIIPARGRKYWPVLFPDLAIRCSIPLSTTMASIAGPVARHSQADAELRIAYE